MGVRCAISTRTSWHLGLAILKSIKEAMKIVHGGEGNDIGGGDEGNANTGNMACTDGVAQVCLSDSH